MAKQDTGEVSIHGKIYLTVARRISDFRSAHPDYSVTSTVLHADERYVQVQAFIADETGRVLSSGLAEEVRAASNINKTSALENAETSAVGRALAFLGLGGTEIASADEVAGAINQQNSEPNNKLLAHNKVLQENIATVSLIKDALHLGDWMYVAQLEAEISQDERAALWVAPSNGGIWTTEERALLKSNEMSAARKQNI
tara:strand:+ start:959 stop:1558 length:600 start_codon:yes stop_codon:yes gene_type:complete